MRSVSYLQLNNNFYSQCVIFCKSDFNKKVQDLYSLSRKFLFPTFNEQRDFVFHVIDKAVSGSILARVYIVANVVFSLSFMPLVCGAFFPVMYGTLGVVAVGMTYTYGTVGLLQLSRFFLTVYLSFAFSNTFFLSLQWKGLNTNFIGDFLSEKLLFLTQEKNEFLEILKKLEDSFSSRNEREELLIYAQLLDQLSKRRPKDFESFFKLGQFHGCAHIPKDRLLKWMAEGNPCLDQLWQEAKHITPFRVEIVEVACKLGRDDWIQKVRDDGWVLKKNVEQNKRRLSKIDKEIELEWKKKFLIPENSGETDLTKVKNQKCIVVIQAEADFSGALQCKGSILKNFAQLKDIQPIYIKAETKGKMIARLFELVRNQNQLDGMYILAHGASSHMSLGKAKSGSSTFSDEILTATDFVPPSILNFLHPNGEQVIVLHSCSTAEEKGDTVSLARVISAYNSAMTIVAATEPCSSAFLASDSLKDIQFYSQLKNVTQVYKGGKPV